MFFDEYCKLVKNYKEFIELDQQFLIKEINDEVEGEDISTLPIEHIHTIMPTWFLPDILKLKENSLIRLLRNVNFNEGLCNSLRLLIKKYFLLLFKWKLKRKDIEEKDLCHLYLQYMIETKE